MNGILNSMSLPNIAAPSEALSIVWSIEQMAHAASDRKMLMSLGFTELAISISAVHSLFITTAWIRSRMIAFPLGFSTLVGLCFMPYESHKARKWSLNLLPLLYIKYQNCGYLLNQVLYTRLLIFAEELSKIISASLVFWLLPFYQ